MSVYNIFATNTLTKGIEVVEHIKTDLDLLWKECFDSELGFTVEQMEFISSQINEIKRTIVSRVELPVKPACERKLIISIENDTVLFDNLNDFKPLEFMGILHNAISTADVLYKTKVMQMVEKVSKSV